MLEYEEDLYVLCHCVGLCVSCMTNYGSSVYLCYRANQVVYYLGLGSSFTALLLFAFQLFHFFWELSRENKVEHFFKYKFLFHSEV